MPIRTWTSPPEETDAAPEVSPLRALLLNPLLPLRPLRPPKLSWEPLTSLGGALFELFIRLAGTGWSPVFCSPIEEEMLVKIASP